MALSIRLNQLGIMDRVFSPTAYRNAIDIFVSGNVKGEVENIITENQNVKNLEEREPSYNKESEKC